MTGPLDTLPPDVRKRLRPAKQPSWISPMLATLTNERFSDKNWIYERKLDGERCLGFKLGSRVRLKSRNNQELDPTYPEIADALRAQVGNDFVVDGEIVAFDGNRTSFERLQGRIGIKDPDQARRTGIAVFYYVFDIPHLDGHDVSRVPQRLRKGLVRRALRFHGPLRYMAHRDAEGEAMYREVCRQGLEGVIAKRADAEYVHARSRDWLKFKCSNEQELVIGGFTDPKGSRVGFGALLVGYYQDGALMYAGKVGTGYDTALLLKLRQQMERLEQPTSPFTEAVREKGAHWLRPKLVAQIAFTEWTRDGKLRHPRFSGMRTDKPAKEVVRERPT